LKKIIPNFEIYTIGVESANTFIFIKYAQTASLLSERNAKALGVF
jgi:hypothetical protein